MTLVLSRLLRPLCCAFVCVVFSQVLGSCQSSWVPKRIEDRRRELFDSSWATSDVTAGRPTVLFKPPELQEDDPGLKAYLHIGLSQNAGLRAAFHRWRSAMERIPQVTSMPDPRFSFSHFVESIETRTGPQEQSLSLSQTFPWFGKLKARGDVQAEEGERLWAGVMGRALIVEREIRSAYYEYAYLAEAIRITDENLTLLKRLEPVAQRKVQGGVGQEDLLRLQVEIGKIENELETLGKYREPLGSRLLAALNWPNQEVLPWPGPFETRPLTVDAKQLRKLLVKDNPDLQALRHEILKQAARVEVAELEGWPDVTLGVSRILTDEANMPGVSGSGDDPFVVSLSLNLPIWRQKYSAAVREATAARSSALGALQQAENDLRVSVNLNVYRLDDAARQMTLYRDSLLPRALQALEVTEVAYRGGTADLTDLIDTQRVYLAFEKAYHRAVADYETALAALDALCGGNLR